LGRFERKVFTHYSCCSGPIESKVVHLYIDIAVGPLWKQGRLLYTLQLQRGALGKCLACLPLNTPLHIIMAKILYDNMKPIEHVLLHPICVLSHLMCVTTEPSDERNLSPGFIQLRTSARINICSATQQPPGRKLETIWHRRAIQTTRQSNAIQRGT